MTEEFGEQCVSWCDDCWALRRKLVEEVSNSADLPALQHTQPLSWGQQRQVTWQRHSTQHLKHTHIQKLSNSHFSKRNSSQWTSMKKLFASHVKRIIWVWLAFLFLLTMRWLYMVLSFANVEIVEISIPSSQDQEPRKGNCLSWAPSSKSWH